MDVLNINHIDWSQEYSSLLNSYVSLIRKEKVTLTRSTRETMFNVRMGRDLSKNRHRV